MKMNAKMWAGVAVIVAFALALWWFAASSSLVPAWSFWQSPASIATSTAATSSSSTLAAKEPLVAVTSSSDVKSIVASLSGASRFQSLFVSTGVSAMIKSSGQYTVFVPRDSAYTNVTKGTISKMTAAQLKRLVEYHVIAGRAVQANRQLSGVVQSLSGDPLNFSDTNNIPMVNSAIIVSEYKGTNGVVYVINNVLIPPQR